MFGTTSKVKDEFINDFLRCTAIHGHNSVGRPTRTYIPQLCMDTGRCQEDLPRVLTNRDRWLERIPAVNAF